MQSILTEFRDSLRHIHTQIQGIEQVNSLLSLDSVAIGAIADPNLRKVTLNLRGCFENRVRRRTFDYAAVIVALYGSFEYFLESLVIAYLSELSATISRFGDLPSKIVENHYELSADLMKRIDIPKYQGTINPNDIVNNLQSCISGGPGYTLNSLAYTYHSSNFKHDVVGVFFAQAGIENVANRALKYSYVVDYFQNQDPAHDDKSISAASNEILRDITQRRNEVAHGSITNVLDFNILIDYMNFIWAYSRSIFELINSEALSYRVQHKSQTLGKPIHVYQEPGVVCFQTQALDISVDDTLIIKRKIPGHGTLYFNTQIRELQVNRVNLVNCIITNPSIVCLKLDAEAVGNFRYFISRNN